MNPRTPKRYIDYYPRDIAMPLIDGGVGVSPSNRTIGTGIHIAGLEKGVLWADGREMYQDCFFWHDLYHLEVSRYFVDLRGPVGGMDAIRKFQLAYEEVIQELQPYERVQVEFINFLGNRETGWLVNAADGISSVREGIKSLLDQENLAQFCRDKIWYRNLLPLNVNRDNPKDVREYLEEAGQRFIAVAEVALTRMH